VGTVQKVNRKIVERDKIGTLIHKYIFLAWYRHFNQKKWQS